MASVPAGVQASVNIRTPASAYEWRTPALRRRSVAAFSSRLDLQQLRAQLDQLHSEAELTQSKSNNARLRLMRLTEAVENLKKRAKNRVLTGKEDEATEILVQKKKLMQALEKLKVRIEVLDKLSAKINEAISLKQGTLIEQLANEPEISRPKESSPDFAKSPLEIGENAKLTLPYRDLLVNVDRKLGLVETDIENFIRPQLLTEWSKQKLSDIMREILSIREMITSLIQTMEDDS